jgi:hypothetical protein
MRLTVCCVSRNKSIYVTTLHMLLQLAAKTIQSGHQINIVFVTDLSELAKLLKAHERILWVNYGSSLDIPSFEHVFKKFEVAVFPAVKEGVNWNQFTEKIKNRTSEPVHQIGLEFDTTVDKKIENGVWTVKESTPAIWCIDCKVIDKLRSRKGEGVKLPHTTEDLFKKFQECGVKCIAYTTSDVLMHYSHECVGSLLEIAGLTCQQVA